MHQNCRVLRTNTWSQTLVFAFANSNNLWKASFCNTIISDKGTAESGQMTSYESHAAWFCSATFSCWGSHALLWHNKCAKLASALFYFPVAILVHRDCSGCQDHWSTVHVSRNLSPPAPAHPLMCLLSKMRSKADDTEPSASSYTASGDVASGEESVVDCLGQFYIFVYCWAYKVQLRQNRAWFAAGC